MDYYSFTSIFGMLIACDMTSSDTRGNTVGILYAVIRLDNRRGAESQLVIPFVALIKTVFLSLGTMSDLTIITHMPSLI